MVLVLPAARTGATALAAVESQLSQESLSRWRSALRDVEVQVQIPRFRLLPPTVSLSDHLEAMGMARAFDPYAEFQGIANLPTGLFISEVFHKAFIEVNEEGTEAAAATAVVMNTRSAAPRPEPPRFIADHPFLFFVMDRVTGAVLFMGRVTDPR
jgi:serpin B